MKLKELPAYKYLLNTLFIKHFNIIFLNKIILRYSTIKNIFMPQVYLQNLYKIIFLLIVNFNITSMYSQQYINSTTTNKNLQTNMDANIMQMSSILTKENDIKYTLPFDSVPCFSELIIERRITELSLTTPIALDYNPVVKKYIDYFAIKKRGLISKMLGMSQYYFPMIESTLDKYHLPMELKYLAIVESALNPTARSKSGAVGLWQFLLPTGQMLNLKINSFIDERQDPVKSTDAACRYLEYLYNTFKDWQLALAAYNGGPSLVRNAIIRSGGKTDFWELRPYLPVETQGYVPAYIALTYVMNYSVEHNIRPDVPKLFYYQVDTVMINQSIYFASIANNLKIPFETVKFLNPSYKTNYIPKSNEPVPLILPANKISAFIQNQRTIFSYSFPTDSILKINENYNNQSKTLVNYIVQKGDYINKIALKYRCSVEDILGWNNLKLLSLTSGTILKIWALNQAENSITDISNSDKKQENINKKLVVYTIQKGDTLFSISQKFVGTTVAEIMLYNKLTNESNLIPGTQLLINTISN